MTVQIGTPSTRRMASSRPARQTAHASRARQTDRAGRDERVLDVAVEVLVRDPAASLAQIAVTAGMGRTTLHHRFATREDLLTAVAHRALDLVDAAIAGARPGPEQPPDFHRLLELAIPIGPYLTFLLTEPHAGCREALLEQRVEALQGPIVAAVRARLDGLGAAQLAVGLPDWWVVSTLHGLLHAAWQAIDAGLLAPRSAPDLVAEWFLHGAAGR